VNKLVIGGIVFVLALLGIVFGVASGQSVDMSGDTVNLYSAIAAVVIVTVAVGVVLKYVNQMQNDKASGELADHEWDGISEYKNELPTGWAVMYIILLGWFIYYVMVKYPLATYSQIGEYNDEVKEYNVKFAEKFTSVEKDPAQLLAMGKSVFGVSCAPCHGALGDGLGSEGRATLKAEDLTKRTLTAAYVTDVINNGSNQLGYANMGGMPAGMAFGDDVAVIANYVASGLKGEQPAAFAACTSCHGANGEGMPETAPSLISYSANAVEHLLTEGSKKATIGQMPAFKEMLNPTQAKAVAVYVESLGAK
jgi:cytochrome c oxidase cbb3-type subunit 3